MFSYTVLIMDNSTAAENSATGSPEICYCSGKPIKSNILRDRVVRTIPHPSPKFHSIVPTVCLISAYLAV